MKNQRRFKATNYSRGCLLAKAFGVSAANSGERTPVTASTRERRRTHLACNASPARTDGRLAVANVRDSCYKIDMEIKLTAVFRKFPEGYAAFVEELPGANTQGVTLEEARENLKEAVAMVLQANRELAEESLRGAEVVREPLAFTTA